MNIFFLGYLLPLFSSLFLAFPVKHSEKFITRLTLLSLLAPIFSTSMIVMKMIEGDVFPLEIQFGELTFFAHSFPFVAWLDRNTFVLLALTHILGLLVVKFSHGYLHLEKGYQRFFSTILFFIFGMEVLSLAGHMDLFFAGWEIVGFSSFLLIAFYRSHSRSVNNAWRVYNIYRICDFGILMGAILGHVLWHEATRFSHLQTLNHLSFSSSQSGHFSLLCFCIVFASLGKSAQFPFHNWPSRAMEGPTPSSAIFYGALSIHAGVFLLIRTEPIWSQSPFAVFLVSMAGLLTIIFSTIQGQIQTNIKGQIAYASTAQVGVMFLEIAMGLHNIVIIHLFCHALYRCFQLLVSPSVVASSTSLNNNNIIQRINSRKSFLDSLSPRFRNTLYVLGMTDFSMDMSWRGFGFVPWRQFYQKLKIFLENEFISKIFFTFSFFLLLSLIFDVFYSWNYYAFGSIALFFSLKAMLGEDNPLEALIGISLSIILCMLSIYLLDKKLIHSIQVYMWSVFPALFLALVICFKFRFLSLQMYHGLGTKHVLFANLFMCSFMVLAGMPISTAFIGEDMLLEELIIHSPLLSLLVSLCLMITGLVCVKIYVRLFMGLPSKVPDKSERATV